MVRCKNLGLAALTTAPAVAVEGGPPDGAIEASIQVVWCRLIYFVQKLVFPSLRGPEVLGLR